MALIKCNHCGNPISDNASFCPKCGTHVTPTAPAIQKSKKKPEAPIAPVSPVNHNSTKPLEGDITQHKEDTRKSNNTHNNATLKIILLLIIIFGGGAIIWLSIQLHELRNFDSDSEVVALREDIQQILEEKEADREEEVASHMDIETDSEKSSASYIQ